MTKVLPSFKIRSKGKRSRSLKAANTLGTRVAYFLSSCAFARTEKFLRCPSSITGPSSNDSSSDDDDDDVIGSCRSDTGVTSSSVVILVAGADIVASVGDEWDELELAPSEGFAGGGVLRIVVLVVITILLNLDLFMGEYNSVFWCGVRNK